ncbi:MAG TPA: serine/threonine-protein kinase [Candidatus Thermoplasmatota archaeon]|nr:serine/threonine-protein kinase [Candidatus Thermoplasmatota archaeon]
MADFEFYLKATAALVSAVFAVVILAGGPKRPANVFLAVFLALIAGNQGLEAARMLVAAPGWDLALFRMATACAALDPFFLYYFASLYPARSRLNAPVPVFLVLAGGILFVALGFLAGPADVSLPFYDFSLAVYTAAVYGIVFGAFVLALRKDPGMRALRLTLIAVSLAALPVLSRVTRAGVGIELYFRTGLYPISNDWFAFRLSALLQTLTLVAIAASLLVAALVLRRRGEVEVARVLTVATLAGLGMGCVFVATDWDVMAELFGGKDVYNGLDRLYEVVYPSSAAFRWMAFEALMSVALIRYDLLGTTLAFRRGAARFIVAAAFIGLALLALALWEVAAGTSLFGPSPAAVILIGLVLLLSQGFRALVDRVAERVYGVPMPGDRGAALDAYRAALTQAVEEGRDLGTDPALQRLREELALSGQEARVMERMVEASVRHPLAAGSRVAGRYRILRLIGRGGSGRVFLAEDEVLHREVVVKEVLEDDVTGKQGSLALREARVAGSLQHPNIVTVHDFIPQTGSALLVIEHLPGGSLARRLEEMGPLPLPEVARVVDGVLSALEAVHARGIVHRDVKPGNVLLTEDGAPKLGDFGVARGVQGETLRVGFAAPQFGGTPGFMAPEQRAGGAVTPATDLYAVGLLLRECGPKPLPAAVEAVVARALQEDPAARWESATAMRRALAAAFREPAVKP